MPSEIGDVSEQMPLLCRPFWWPWWGVEAIHAASPDAACLGLHRKPLDAAIGRLLAPYRLGGHQGDSKQNNDVIFTHFDGHFDGHRDAVVLQWYYTVRIAWWRRSRALIKATKHRHRVSTRSDSVVAVIAILLFGLMFEVWWRFCSREVATFKLGCDISIWREGLGGWSGILILGC